jgi:LCP family protein required for cell wall assembly
VSEPGSYEPVSSAPASSAPVRRSRLRRALLAVTITFALLIGVVGVGAYALYRHLDSNITVDPSADGELGGSPSAAAATSSPSPTRAGDYQPENILVMGSDTRVGQGGEGGSAKVYSTAQSDVVLLVHLSGDRKHALVMSIPRDTWITLPRCTSKSGSTVGGFDAKFNEAFTIGGPACTIKAVKQMTDLTIDHFVVVDFNGVKNIIDAMGGVQFCLKQALHDPIQNGHGSGLDLPAGPQVVGGEQGLAFLRARYTIADGSDISRLDRQHAFLGAMARQLEQQATITNLPKLYGLLDAVTKSITTDTGLGSLLKLKDLAQSLVDLKPANVTMLTIPWRPRGDGSNVLVDQTQAKPILDAIRDDTPYPPTVAPAPTPTPGQQPLKTKPSAVHVRVLNATGTPGAATKAAAALEQLGFQVDSVGTASSVTQATTVTYDPAYDESARTLAAAVKGGATSRAKSGQGRTLVLTIGTGWTGVQAVTVAGTTTTNGSVPATARLRTAADSGCV